MDYEHRLINRSIDENLRSIDESVRSIGNNGAKALASLNENIVEELRSIGRTLQGVGRTLESVDNRLFWLPFHIIAYFVCIGAGIALLWRLWPG
jgi:hypothetical protein